MPKGKQHEDDPDAWLKDYPTHFDPKYRYFIAENKAGRLSPRQRDLILEWDYQIPPNEVPQVRYTISMERPSRIKVALFYFAIGLMAAIVSVYLPNPSPVSCMAIIVCWGLAYWSVMPRLLTTEEIDQFFRAETAKRRERLCYQISARKVIRIEGVPSYETLYAVTVEGEDYIVEPPLYRWLRVHSSRVAVYAIEGWYPPYALSVEPLDVPIPLTPEERLQTVVGVSSEGELVYADDPPNEDARRIDRP